MGAMVMADFCLQCSLEMFGKDFEELKGLGNGKTLEPEYGWPAICEGCGMTLVDDAGVCLGKCLKNHDIQPKWVSDHITYDKESKKFIAWDETQAYELGRFNNRQQAISACWVRAAELSRDRDYQKTSK
jgi:hypothetical protein